MKSSKQGITIHLDRPSSIYTKGEILVISGTDAGNTASVSIKISNNSTMVDTLPTTSTNRGDYNTSWQIPHSINPGTYAVEASSITGKATISLRVQ